MSEVFVTDDGDTLWLECFAEDPDAEHGQIIHPISAGDDWDSLAQKVAAHEAEHGCAAPRSKRGDELAAEEPTEGTR